MNPLKMRFAEAVTAGKSDEEIRQRMANLRKIGKGEGNDMYDALAKILEKRGAHK